MRLATKLFFFIGALLLVICIAIYLVPAYITSKELLISRGEYLANVEKQRAVQHRAILDWLTEMMGSVEGRLDSYLLMVNGHPHLKESLSKDDRAIWFAQTYLLSVGSDLDLIQVTDRDGANAVVNLASTHLYRAKVFPVEPDIAWVLLHVNLPGETLRDRELLGIWIPSSIQQIETNVPTTPPAKSMEVFLLFDPAQLMGAGDKYADLLKEKGDELKQISLPTVPKAGLIAVNLLERMDRATKYLSKTFRDNPQALDAYLRSIGTKQEDLPLAQMVTVRDELKASGPTASPYANLVKRPGDSQDTLIERSFGMQLGRLLRSSNEVELVNALGLLTAVGALWDSPLDKEAPLGAARIAPTLGIGSAVFTEEVFSGKQLFDIGGLFEKFPPISEDIPIASDFGLLVDHEANNISMVNGLELAERSYLTLGSSLVRLASRLQEVTAEPTMLVADGKVIVSRNGDEAVIEDINQHPGRFTADNGFLTIAGTEYYYSNYKPKPGWDLSFVTLRSAKEVLASTLQFEQRSKALARTLSFHIIAAAIGVFVLALLALELIARHFTKPIRVLANATEQVRRGEYGDVVLPKIRKHSKNEIAVLTHSFGEMVHGLADRERIRGVLDKVVSREIADEILQGKVELGGEVKEITVLFADIRNFTALTEKLPPEEVIPFVNSLMTILTRVVEKHQGVIDKYIGDSLMALFGAPVAHPMSTFQAVLAALVMISSLKEWNEERSQQGLFTVELGIGVHAGKMVAGNMGAEDRLNYTVLGANVNLASRLCSKAKGMQILISEHVLEDPHVKEAIAVEARDPIQLKGFSEPVPVYEVIGLKSGFLLGKLSQQAAEARREDDA